jgi:hypothetical protein
LIFKWYTCTSTWTSHDQHAFLFAKLVLGSVSLKGTLSLFV